MKMRPEDTLHIEQIKNLGRELKKRVGRTTTKDGMFGGIATWDRENKSFIIHKSGATSEGNLKHIEVECLDAVDDLIKKKILAYENLIYLYLNKAPCADYNGNRKNCLDKVIKWAKNNPSRKLVLGFRRPYAIGSFTERGSWRRPDKDIWPLYKMNLMCRDLPQNLVIFAFIKADHGPNPQVFQNSQLNDNLAAASLYKKARKEEDKLKLKMLKNRQEKVIEFDKEKHLIKSFILANRKQSKEIERDKKLIFGKGSRESSNGSNRSRQSILRKSLEKVSYRFPLEVN